MRLNQARTFFGRFFVVLAPQAKGAPLIDQCWTREKEPPWRFGHGFLIRPPFTKHRETVGLVLGVWKKPEPAVSGD
jgi:hypothetical protein